MDNLKLLIADCNDSLNLVQSKRVFKNEFTEKVTKLIANLNNNIPFLLQIDFKSVDILKNILKQIAFNLQNNHAELDLAISVLEIIKKIQDDKCDNSDIDELIIEIKNSIYTRGSTINRNLVYFFTTGAGL